MPNSEKVCVVVGVGPGCGAAFARLFGKQQYRVALLARSTEFSTSLAAELPGSKAFACDVSDAASIQRAFQAVRSEMGDPEVMIYNAGSGTFGGFDDVTAEAFEASWRVNAMGAFNAAKEVVPAMKKAGHGNIVFVGATASRRGVPRTVAFAPAKAAQKSLAEALARTLWPLGIHVSLIILDGVVDLPRARQWLKDKPDSFFVKPDDVAAVALQLTEQQPSAWSFEVEARPFGESW